MRAIFLYAICLLPVSVFSAQPPSPQDAEKAKQMQESGNAMRRSRSLQNKSGRGG